MVKTEPRRGPEPAWRPRLDPELVAEQWTARSGTLDLRIPRDLDCWPGHFPGRPVVPGFLQLDWVMRFASRWLSPAARVRSIEGLKFKSVLGPGERCTLTLERSGDGAGLRFRLAAGERIVSLGRFELAGEEGSGE
jgi:hypothetical protein